jgi:hypothetical protein
MSSPPPSNKDGQQVLRYAFDDASGTLRTTAVLEPGTIDLEIHYVDDSIAIGDPATNNILGITANNEAKVDLTSVGGAAITEGQKTSANSIPVVIASDQSPIAVVGSISTSPNVNVHDGTGVSISSTGSSLNVDVTNTVPVSQSGPWNITNVTGTVSLPTGASTSANQTNGSQKTQIVDGSGNVVGPEQAVAGTNYLPVVLAASSIPGSALVPRSVQVAGSDGTNARTLLTNTSGNLLVVSSSVDASPATQNVTAQDTASTTTPQANNQNFITGSPTAGSTASFTISSLESVEVQVTGTWTGTLSSEVSMDGGTTWFTRGVKQAGASYISSTFTANFAGGLNVSGMTNYRVRATAPWTGTATVKVNETVNAGSITVTNPLTLRDATTQSITNTIKANAVSPATTDTGLVTTLRPSAGTITQAAVTVGTTAIRATVSGSSPATTRSVLLVSPDNASTANFYIGSSTVANSGASRGVQLLGGDQIAFNNDAADYWIISDTAGQTVYILEEA